jgi:hypothetical protein
MIALPDEIADKLDRERHRRDVPVATIIQEALAIYFERPARRLAISALGHSGQRTIARDAEVILERNAMGDARLGKRRNRRAEMML